MTEKAADPFWHDREIRFDVRYEYLDLRKGEFLIDSMRQIEDTKGNNGENGELQVTNLRLLWISSANLKTNLSVGLGAVVSINIRTANSRLRGNSQALYVLTKFNGSRFEFIFTNLVRDSPRLFTTVQAVFRAYDTSKLYRDLKLRGAVISEKELIQLPDEQIFNKIPGVWNLSADQVCNEISALGAFFIIS
jgi:Bardet-Biedl syndrome 5 protein